jgi:plasmid stability protein
VPHPSPSRVIDLASRQLCKHNASMPNVLVRDLPDDVHQALQRKAEQRNESLQQYLSAELRKLAERQPISDILDEIDARRGGRVGLGQAARDLGEARTER